jgi:ubiquinone/menaquinone biosynthesis C-methylase UbiE
MLARLVRQVLGRSSGRVTLDPVDGYDRWAATYDSEPENLVMEVDQAVFADLLARVTLTDKAVVDIGCGTGRHWAKLMAGRPASLVGYDASSGMLARLRAKRPGAIAHRANADQLGETRDGACDLVVSTLTLCHVTDVGAVLEEWSRVLRPGGDLLLTDFHPASAASGLCSFQDPQGPASVRLYRYTMPTLLAAARRHGFTLLHRAERVVDEAMRGRYAAFGMQAVFERTKGLPLVYGLHLRKAERRAS